MMMKSAIDWLMGKSATTAENNETLIASLHLNANTESVTHNNETDTSKVNSLLNGQFSDNILCSKSGPSIESSERRRRPSGEEIRSPWGRTLTPKSPKFAFDKSIKKAQVISGGRNFSARNKSSLSWEEMSFASEVSSPGFSTRIAKEGRVKKPIYDGSRKYPVGQEKFIRSGILPNVRLKGQIKPVVLARRAPTSPLLPLASCTSPFSSTASPGFLASASTRMPDISSVVSVLDSTPSASATESINDPTSLQAVVAALEQAQNLKSGVKRSRYLEPEDSNKKQKCLNNSNNHSAQFSMSVVNNNFSAGGGEKRALDISSPSSADCSLTENQQLSPENKRRCIPDPRVASFSSSKNYASNILNVSGNGRESPFFMYESHQDSDSESNKSLDSHHSIHSDQSFQAQNNISSGRISNQDLFDRSGSQTPQSQRGSYGIGGLSNGSSSSSRTTTPSRPSHAFSLEAYKADKAKSQQRLNKMLGMLFNVSDEEALASIEAQKLNPLTSLDCVKNLASASISLAAESTIPTKSAVPIEQQPMNGSSKDIVVKDGDVSATYTFTIKPPSNGAKIQGDKLPVSEKQSLVPSNEIVSKPDLGNVLKPNLSSPSTLDKSLVSKPETSKLSVSSGGTSLADLLSKGHTMSSSSVSATFDMPKLDKLQKDVTSTSSELKNKAIEPPKYSFTSSSLFPANTDCSESSKISNSPLKNKLMFSSSNQDKPTTVSNTSNFGDSTFTSFVNNSIVSGTSANLKPPGISFGTVSKDTSKLEAKNSIPPPSLSAGIFQFNTGAAATTSASSISTPFSSIPSMFSLEADKGDAAKKSEQSKLSQPSLPVFSFGSNDANSTKSLGSVISSSENSKTSSSPSIFNFQPSQITSDITSKSTIPVATINSNNSLNNSAPPAFSFGSGFGNATGAGGNSTTANNSATSKSITGGIFSFGNTATAKSVENTTGKSQDSPFSFGSSMSPAPPIQPSFASNTTNSSAPVFGSTGGGFSFGPNPKATSSTKTLSTSSAAFSFGSSTTSSTSSSGFNFNPISSSQPFNFSSSAKDPTVPSTTASNSNLFTFGNNDSGKSSTSSTFGAFGEPSTTTSITGFSFGSQKLPESAPSFSAPLTFGATSTDKSTSKSLFGNTDIKLAPSFGSSGTAPFNTTPASNMFGNGNNNSTTFGAKVSTNLFGSSSSTFGSSAAAAAPSVFGTTNTAQPTAGSAFGTANAAPPTFGSSNTPAFGSQTVPTFGSSTTGISFGSSDGSSTGFGSANATTFGSTGPSIPQLGNLNSSTTFGSSKPSSFGSGPPANTFSFGQSAASSSPAAGIFQFGPAGTGPAMPSFNPVGPGTPGDAASVSRRPKARAYRRR